MRILEQSMNNISNTVFNVMVFNVWLGIMGNISIASHFLPTRLNTNGFLIFLNNELYDFGKYSFE